MLLKLNSIFAPLCVLVSDIGYSSTAVNFFYSLNLVFFFFFFFEEKSLNSKTSEVP
jgi:hypothetical protein